MSAFFSEDLVQFKKDPLIYGTIHLTWSDVESDVTIEAATLYAHKDLPRKARRKWFREGLLTPGLVIVGFPDNIDGFCLVSEEDLVLADRAFAVGDIVRKSASDTQSGTVLSTSIKCALEPVCTLQDFIRPFTSSPVGYAPSHGPRTSVHRHTNILSGNNAPSPVPSTNESRNLNWVSASELKNWNAFREMDFVLYRDWIGCVRTILDEVTIRLGNGSVVVTENTEEFEEPQYIPGSFNHILPQRLDYLGFNRCGHSRDVEKAEAPQWSHVLACYPGLAVRTKKGNLRRGNWKFGAYDPNVSPQGIVVDVRIVGLEVDWISPNVLNDELTKDSAPDPLIDVDTVQSDEISVYDRGRVPKNLGPHALPEASHTPDWTLGNMVRFRDSAGAALKYSNAFNKIPRTATQGFDMNLLKIVSTSTTILVQWQDGSISTQHSTSVVQSIDTDDNEVWPGERVSYKPDENRLDEGLVPMIRCPTVGIVQSVNAEERLARVRWFDEAVINVDADHKDWAATTSRYGRISDRITQVSIYDLAAHPAFRVLLSDFAIVAPNSSIQADPCDLKAHLGEVVGLCLDGDLVVRCGTSDHTQDLEIPFEKLVLITAAREYEGTASEEGDHVEDIEEDEGADEWHDEIDSDMDNESQSTDPIDIEIEYEGGRRVGPEDDSEGLWSTEEDSSSDERKASRKLSENPHNTRELKRQDPPLPSTKLEPSDFPLSFLILDGDAPSDHHFVEKTRPISGRFLKKITREHKIMKDSLPEGVFVRTWESRLDLLRVLIVGPVDTPYEHAPFVLDMFFDEQYPESAPETFFYSWTERQGRINPNLYEDGKICLSLLGTWPSDERNESWNPRKSTVLQILVSILGLVLVKEPYYSEFPPNFNVMANHSLCSNHSHQMKPVSKSWSVPSSLVCLPNCITRMYT